MTTTPDTVVLSAAVTDTSPEQAAAIANALAEEFVGLVGQLEEPIGPTAAGCPGTAGAAAAPVAEPTRIGVEIIRPAAPQPTPISPNVPFNLALGIALGLLVGIAAAFVRNARDTRVRSAERLQELTGAPVLSEIASDRDARLHPLTLGAPPGSARVESFRKLRTNLQFLEPTRPHRVVVVTSATVGEGKSTTACNLALALADAGSRVLLIDLNLRLPQVDRYLQVEPGRRRRERAERPDRCEERGAAVGRRRPRRAARRPGAVQPQRAAGVARDGGAARRGPPALRLRDHRRARPCCPSRTLRRWPRGRTAWSSSCATAARPRSRWPPR